MTIEDIRELLKIEKLEDIKSAEFNDPYTDDHCMCIEGSINGIRIDFLWRDTLGFLDYFRVCEEAFTDLKINILNVLDMESDELFQDPSITAPQLEELEQLGKEIRIKLDKLCTV